MIIGSNGRYGIYKIYKITNLINGMIYIGQTVKRIGDRWSHHKSPANGNSGSTYMWRAIQKYGPENFTIEWITSAISKDDINYLEEKLIRENNSLTPNGYNIKAGGHDVYFTDEMKKLMSEGQKRRYSKMTKEERKERTKQFTEYIENKKVSVTGVNLETREIITFKTIMEADEAGFSHSQIYKSLKSYGTSKGYYFFYTGEYTEEEMFILAEKQRIDINKSKQGSRKKALENPNMKQHIENQKVPYIGINPKTLEYSTFESMSEATRAGYNTDAMRRGARGEKRTSKKLHFQKYTLTPEEHIEITKEIFKK